MHNSLELPYPRQYNEAACRSCRAAGMETLPMALAPPATKDNPLVLGTPKTLLPQPGVLVIFGGAGDLAWRKLLPAVYNLNIDGVLPSHFAVVGFGLPSAGGDKCDPDVYIRNRAQDGIERFSRQPLSES